MTIGSLKDWQKERQLKSLSDKRVVSVKVIRDGEERVVDIQVCSVIFCSSCVTALTTSVLFIYQDVVVGDIALVKPVDIIQVFLSGFNVKCANESA